MTRSDAESLLGSFVGVRDRWYELLARYAAAPTQPLLEELSRTSGELAVLRERVLDGLAR